LKKMFGSTTWEKTASSTLLYIAPLIETISGLAAGGPAETIVTAVINKVQAALGTLSVVISGAATTPTASDMAAAVAALNSIKTNLSSLLQVAEVKSAPKSAEITEAVNTVIGEVDAIASNVSTAAVPGVSVATA
jgi:hypothetical protein